MISCNYSVPTGLVDLLVALTDHSKKDVWLQLTDEAQVCFDRLQKKNMSESWRWFTYPDTEIRMKLKIHKSWHNDGTFRCDISYAPDCYETFSQEDVNSYLDDLLLGAE